MQSDPATAPRPMPSPADVADEVRHQQSDLVALNDPAMEEFVQLQLVAVQVTSEGIATLTFNSPEGGKPIVHQVELFPTDAPNNWQLMLRARLLDAVASGTLGTAEA